MPLISAADLDFALQDFAGSQSPNVTYGAQSCYGDLKRATLEELIDSGLHRAGSHITLLIRDGALTGLVDESSITVNGAPFTIRDSGEALADGSRLLTLVDLTP